MGEANSRWLIFAKWRQWWLRSEPGYEEVSFQLMGADTWSSSSNLDLGRRPIGTKMTKATELEAGDEVNQSKYRPPMVGYNFNVPVVQCPMADAVRMTLIQLGTHCQGIQLLKAQMDLLPGEVRTCCLCRNRNHHCRRFQ